MKIATKLSFPLCLLLLTFTSCSNEKKDISNVVVGTGTTLRTAIKLYSGKDLFKGIFFQRGPVSKQISDIFTYQTNMYDFTQSDEEKNAAVRIQDEVILQIEKKSPSFMNEFGRKIQSGDHLLVMNAIDEGAKMFQKHMMSISDIYQQKGKLMLNGISLEDLDYNQFTANNKIDKVKLQEYILKKIKESSISKEKQVGNDGDDCVINIAVVANIVFAVAVVWEFVLVVDVASAKLCIGDRFEGGKSSFEDIELKTKSEMIVNVITNRLSIHLNN